MNAELYLGIDVGGTFTDVILLDPSSGRLESIKVLTTSPDQSEGCVTAARALLAGAGRSAAELGRLIHGTTMATNALLERKGARTALITTRGFRDVLEIGRAQKHRIYDIHDDGRPAPLVPRRRRIEVNERMGPDGEIEDALDRSQIPSLQRWLADNQVEALAICLVNAYANPTHEQILADALSGSLSHVYCSSDVNREYREFERASTTVANAYLAPLVDTYLDRLEGRLREAAVRGRLFIVQSNGGMAPADTIRRRPITTLFSGPAAGVTACKALLEPKGVSNLMTFDMGGTSTDVALIHEGRVGYSTEFKLGGLPIRTPTIDLHSIGAGGGSLARIDPGGSLRVGPESAGADPGPACYGRGGSEPTVTDANVLLGRIRPSHFTTGGVRIDESLAREAIAPLARRFEKTAEEMALGIVAIANHHMAQALRRVSVARGHDPRHFTLVAFGGAGPLHATALASTLGIPRVVVPPMPSVLSALGTLLSKVRHDYVRTALCPVEALPFDTFEELERQAREELTAEGFSVESAQFLRSADLRYAGQNYELNIQVALADDPPSLRRGFEERHQSLYSYTTDEGIEVVNLRLTALVPSEPIPLRPSATTTPARPLEQRKMLIDVGWVEAPVFARADLMPGQVVVGPALIEEEGTTSVIAGGYKAALDDTGFLVVEV
jgi:N-methylhydantoinase A